MRKFYLLFFIVSCNNVAPTISHNKPSTLEERVIVSTCPSNMIWVQGQYCSKVIQNCKIWLEPPKSTSFARCQEYFETKCVGELKTMNFCIDKFEFSNLENQLPLSNVSWIEAKNICEVNGKRLCQESEWEFACEGEQSLPYPTGYTRPSSICNIDKFKNIICGNGLCDYRNSITENDNCVSPFNIHNMSGNVDEWIEVPKYAHSKVPDLWMRSALKGGHWLPVRNRCRPKTVDHDESFYQISVGFRCCKDI